MHHLLPAYMSLYLSLDLTRRHAATRSRVTELTDLRQELDLGLRFLRSYPHAQREAERQNEEQVRTLNRMYEYHLCSTSSDVYYIPANVL